MLRSSRLSHELLYAHSALFDAIKTALSTVSSGSRKAVLMSGPPSPIRPSTIVPTGAGFVGFIW